MNGFKLLAITPLEGCHLKIRKNLKIGSIYQFYSNYTLQLSPENTGINFAKKNNTENNSLFRVNNKLSLNIHSIVGENGSGKSSIFELYYYFIYLLGSTHSLNDSKQLILPIIDKDLLFKKDLIKKQIENFNQLTKSPINLNRKNKKIVSNQILHEAIQISKDHDIEIERSNLIGRNFNTAYFQVQLINKEVSYQNEVNKQDLSFQKIKQKVACSIIYEIDSIIHEATYINDQFSFSQFNADGGKEKTNSLNLEDFFYTISLNYSHHSLNSISLGRWINKLFHKNDAYITPLVINPMRVDGNFDINDELHLSKERILMNIISSLISDENFTILNKYKVSKVIYRLKEHLSPISNFKFENLDEQFDELLNHPWKITIPGKEYPLNDFALGYLQRKIVKLKNQYAPLFIGNTENLKLEELDVLLNKITKTLILQDSSHITKKINQTVNFIKHFDSDIWHFESKKENTIKENEIILDISQLRSWVKNCNPKYIDEDSFELSIIAHPGIFNVDFVLQDESGEELFFKDLSSGEQQLIFNINTIIYHVNNLNSAHKTAARDELPRPRYKNLNVVLDEIELYYHPEYQRKFISNLINELDQFSKNIDLSDRIESINVCFLTHSPFILSDIPKTNVLRLENGKPSKKEFKQTFGANIHELLANDFFLKNGFMGEFAKEKIENIISYLKSENLLDSTEKIEQMKEIIELVGEPIIRSRLKQLFKLHYPAFADENDDIDERIRKQREVLDQLEKQKRK